MTGLPYFYDSQLRVIFSHFVRVFSGFKVKTGRDSQGFDSFITVPAMWGAGDRQALHIVNQNSENTMLSVPRIACYVQAMSLATDRRGYGANEEDLQVTERNYDRENGTYGSGQGNNYHVKRLYPNPLDITMVVDIVTSNTEQKCQLFEQIYLIFNPVFEMQITSNPLHYTPIKRITIEDISWDAQGIPKGVDDELSIMTLTFKVEADIAPPARVKKQTLIHTIIKEIGFGDSFEDILGWSSGDVVYSIVTPGDHTIKVSNGQILLQGPYQTLQDENNDYYSWPQLIDMYGELKPGYSKIRLRWVSDVADDSQDIFGYIDFHPTLDNILIFNVDQATLPATTIADVDQVINPHTQIPGVDLPVAAIGQRYIVTDEIGSQVGQPWGVLVAQASDIIEYDGSVWTVVYNASASNTVDIVKDSSTGIRYKLDNHIWVDFINTDYLAGFFRIMI